MLTRVKRATKRRAKSEEAWRSAITEAHANGESLRDIARAAGVSHVRVLQIVREETGPIISDAMRQSTSPPDVKF